MAWLARSPPGYFTNSSILVTLGGVLIALVSPSEHDHSPRARTPTTRRTRDRMVRRTNRATANVHRCFFASACSATFKNVGPVLHGGMVHVSLRRLMARDCSNEAKVRLPDPISFGHVRPERGCSLLAHDHHFPNVFISIRSRKGGTGLVEKRSIGLRVPRSPGGNRKLSRRIGQ